MTEDEIVEWVGDALAPYLHDSQFTLDARNAAPRAAIAAHTAAIAEAGFVIVPREPTNDMLKAVIPFPARLRHKHPDAGDPWHEMMAAACATERAVLRQRYREMIAAVLAPPAKE